MFAAVFSTLILTNLSAVTECMAQRQRGVQFRTVATVTCIADNMSCSVGLKDATDEIVALGTSPYPCVPGDIVRVTGRVWITSPNGNMFALIETLHVLGHTMPPKPTPVTADKLNDGRYFGHYVSIKGVVVDSFRDEIDTHTYFLALDCDRETVYVYFTTDDDLSPRLSELNNAEVVVTGNATLSSFGYRRYAGHIVHVREMSDVRVTKTPRDQFDAPDLDFSGLESPSDILRLGRRRIAGKVVATRRPRQVLLKTALERIVSCEISGILPLPAVGQHIEAVGFAETDLYNVNLSHSIWRPSTDTMAIPDEQPTNLDMTNLFMNVRGKRGANPLLHGRLLRLRGTVKSVGKDGIAEIESDNDSLSVDASAEPRICDRLTIGETVSVTGVAVMNTENWQPYAPFPHIRGFTVIPRTTADIKVLSTPSWWTIPRLIVVICILFTALVGFVIWNWILNRIVERRSRQLAREKMAHDRADVRAEERTRLSVELHDTIAQNLSGIALQLDAVQLAAEDEPELLFDNIRTTQQSLNSCRQNLRHCLWDLRSRTFEEKSLDGALSRTLKPHRGNACLGIDCPIRTQGMSDNAIHAILCIIRELVINSIRHGKASHISVVGRETSGTLDFCVSDDGSGFDPMKAPGVAEGHFGLQGIRERVHQLNGTLEITSQPGGGTTVKLHNLSTNI